jgi:hypothetical protein
MGEKKQQLSFGALQMLTAAALNLADYKPPATQCVYTR